MSEQTAVAEVLEQLVDGHSLAFVLDALAEVCGAKSAHLEENWQDKTSAVSWGRAARWVEQLASRCAAFNL